MTLVPTMLFLASCLLAAVGAYHLKKGSAVQASFLLRIMHKSTICAVIIYGITGIISVFVLHYLEVSVVYPLTATTYVWTLLIGKFFLKEEVRRAQYIGMALIIIGVLFLSFG